MSINSKGVGRTGVIAVGCLFGLLGAAVIVAKPWVTIQHAEPIMVKGYAETTVKADAGSLTVEVVQTNQTNAKAYEAAGQALDQVKTIVTEALPEDLEMNELKTAVKEVTKIDENGRRTNEIDYFTVTRSIRINTKDVESLKALGRKLYDLNQEGIRINLRGPDFYVSHLDEVKLELVRQATENGKQRATLMAQSSDEKLGTLVSAKQGVIQITKKNSSETSSWGIYDTETIDKVVKLVVTLEYAIDR